MPFARWSALPSGNHLSEQNIRLCDCTSGLLRRKGHWWSLWDWPRWIPDITELQRSKQNYSMLYMILDEWMPWYRENPDLSTIDINRYSKKYCIKNIVFFMLEH